MTTHPIDRDRLRRYLSHAAMLLPPDERVVTVEEGLALLEELDALQAIHRDALSHARRIIAHPDRWHHQDLVDATSNLLSALKGAPTVRDGATQWRDRAVRAEAQSETRRQQTKYWQERAEGFEAERDEAEKVHRDLTSSLGFGDDITEPMADNETIIEHVSRAVTDAQELWELTQAECAEAGCDPEEDCYTHHPERRAERAEVAEEQLLLRNRNLLYAHREAEARIQTARDEFARAHEEFEQPRLDVIRRALDAP